MSKSRIIPCENAHNTTVDFMKYAKQKTAIHPFCANIFRQQYLQNSCALPLIWLINQNLHYHLTSSVGKAIIQIVSEKRLNSIFSKYKKEGFYYGNRKEDYR